MGKFNLLFIYNVLVLYIGYFQCHHNFYYCQYNPLSTTCYLCSMLFNPIKFSFFTIFQSILLNNYFDSNEKKKLKKHVKWIASCGVISNALHLFLQLYSFKKNQILK